MISLNSANLPESELLELCKSELDAYELFVESEARLVSLPPVESFDFVGVSELL